jgi:hypothetical protein
MLGSDPVAWTPTFLPFRSVTLANAFAGEQFDAADHHAADNRNGRAGVDVPRELRRIGHAEIDCTPRERRRDLGRRCIDKADIGKAFGDVLRGIADALVLHHAYRGRFERSLGAKRSRRAYEACSASQ